MHEEQGRGRRWEAYAKKAGFLDDHGICQAGQHERTATSWYTWEACEKSLASLAKPQPVGGALTKDGIMIEVAKYGHAVSLEDFTEAERIYDELSATLFAATLSAPVSQPGEAVSEPKPWAQKTALEKAPSIIMQLEVAAERFTRYSHDTIDYLLQEAADALRTLSVAPSGDEITCPHCREAIAVRYPECWDATPIAAQPAAAEPTILFDGMTAAQLVGNELFEFQEATGCDTAAQFRALAAPAQAAAVPESSSVSIDFRQATELLEMFGGEPTEITLMAGDGHSGPGLYAVYNADPEGSVHLGETDEEAVPDAPVAQAAAVPEAVERAAFERHIRSAWKVPESYLDWALKRNDRGYYIDSRAADQWSGWQARAALSQGDVSGEGEGS